MHVDEVHAIVFAGHKFSDIKNNPEKYARESIEDNEGKFWVKLKEGKRDQLITAHYKEHNIDETKLETKEKNKIAG